MAYCGSAVELPQHVRYWNIPGLRPLPRQSRTPGQSPLDLHQFSQGREHSSEGKMAADLAVVPQPWGCRDGAPVTPCQVNREKLSPERLKLKLDGRVTLF